MCKKIIVDLYGGLGNQLFQYAFAKSLESIYDVKIEFNTNFFYKNFKDQTIRKIGLTKFGINFIEQRKNIIEKLITKEPISVLIPKINHKYFNEKNLNHYNFDKIELKNKNYFTGYWQNYKYFDLIKKELKVDLSLDHNLINLDSKIIKEISNSNSLCIHVRRTDYIGTPYEIVDIEYYKKGYELISTKISSLKTYVFSDDINWAMKNLSFIPNTTFCNYSMINDFHLMTLCKYFIIPNSTFSWWAAYLSDFKNKIVFIPDKWHKTNQKLMNNASPSNWITLKHNHDNS